MFDLICLVTTIDLFLSLYAAYWSMIMYLCFWQNKLIDRLIDMIITTDHKHWVNFLGRVAYLLNLESLHEWHKLKEETRQTQQKVDDLKETNTSYNTSQRRHLKYLTKVYKLIKAAPKFDITYMCGTKAWQTTVDTFSQISGFLPW